MIDSNKINFIFIVILLVIVVIYKYYVYKTNDKNEPKDVEQKQGNMSKNTSDLYDEIEDLTNMLYVQQLNSLI